MLRPDEHRLSSMKIQPDSGPLASIFWVKRILLLDFTK